MSASIASSGPPPRRGAVTRHRSPSRRPRPRRRLQHLLREGAMQAVEIVSQRGPGERLPAVRPGQLEDAIAQPVELQARSQPKVGGHHGLGLAVDGLRRPPRCRTPIAARACRRPARQLSRDSGAYQIGGSGVEGLAVRSVEDVWQRAREHLRARLEVMGGRGDFDRLGLARTSQRVARSTSRRLRSASPAAFGHRLGCPDPPPPPSTSACRTPRARPRTRAPGSTPGRRSPRRAGRSTSCRPDRRAGWRRPSR